MREKSTKEFTWFNSMSKFMKTKNENEYVYGLILYLPYSKF